MILVLGVLVLESEEQVRLKVIVPHKVVPVVPVHCLVTSLPDLAVERSQCHRVLFSFLLPTKVGDITHTPVS